MIIRDWRIGFRISDFGLRNEEEKLLGGEELDSWQNKFGGKKRQRMPNPNRRLLRNVECRMRKAD